MREEKQIYRILDLIAQLSESERIKLMWHLKRCEFQHEIHKGVHDADHGDLKSAMDVLERLKKRAMARL